MRQGQESGCRGRGGRGSGDAEGKERRISLQEDRRNLPARAEERKAAHCMGKGRTREVKLLREKKAS